MKNYMVLALLLVSSVAVAGENTPSNDCLKKVVQAVDKKHKANEGVVIALRELYSGEYASALLVGHSDENTPTDFLVLVDKNGCKLKSMLTTNEAESEKYTPAERALAKAFLAESADTSVSE